MGDRINKTQSYFELDYDSYKQELICALEDPGTHFYLDTCFLNKLLFTREDARKLILSWLQNRIDHVHIPYWVYMEYMKRAVNIELLKSISPWSEFKFKNSLERLKENLYLYLDDKVAKSCFKDVYECREKYDEAVSIIGKIEKMTNDFSVAHNEISELFFPNCVMEKIKDLSKLEKDFNIRCENKIPPGFDEDKKTNVYGDFFIWNEILNKQEVNHKAIFLSNDQKKDWVYTPQKILLDGKLIPNEAKKSSETLQLPIRIASPQLCLEFLQKTNTDDIFIVTRRTFMEILYNKDDVTYRPFLTLLACDGKFANSLASNPDEELPNSSVSCSETGSCSKESFETESLKKYSIRALHDSEYVTNPSDKLDLCIEKFKSHNWYTQSSGFNDFLQILSGLDKNMYSKFLDDNKNALFILGRNIYQAACGSENDSLAYISNLHANIVKLNTDDRQNYVLDGMFYEVHFDKFGQLRENPKAKYFNLLMDALEAGSTTELFIRTALDSFKGRMIYLPGDSVVQFKIDWNNNGKENLINSIKWNGHELLRPCDEREYIPNNCYLYETSYTSLGHSLVKCLSKLFLIPQNKIELGEFPLGEKWSLEPSKYVNPNLPYLMYKE